LEVPGIYSYETERGHHKSDVGREETKH
jgi:hypothetical protein